MANPCNILLVDDEPANLLALETVLDDLGCVLTRCSSGEDALRELLRSNFAVVLLDLQMPTMSGTEVARLLRAREVTKSTPIIFITALDAQSSQIDEAYSVGAVDFLAKPINPHILRAKVRFFVELHLKNEQVRVMSQALHDAQLRDSQERTKLVMEHVKDWAFVELSVDGKVQGWGGGAKAITGWEEAEVLGRDIEFLFTAEDAMAGLPTQERAEATVNGRASDQRWHKRKDGTLFYAEGVVVAVRSTSGALISLTKIFQDATARVASEAEREQLFKEARAANDRLSNIFAQAPAFLCALRGPEHIVEMANERYYQLIGNRPAIIGRRLRDVLPEIEAQGFLGLLDDVYRTGSPFVGNGVDVRLRQADGAFTTRVLDFVYTALRDADGNVTGVLAHGVDITDKVTLAAQADATDQRYRKVIESIDEAFCLIEMLYGENGTAVDYRFIEVNPEFVRHTGLGHDCVGKRVSELVPNLDPAWIARYAHVVASGESTRFSDGAAAMDRWFDGYATRLGGEGSRIVAVLFRDVTKERRADEDLRRLAAELSEASRRKSEFLAVLAHELRNPLAPIRTGLELMRVHPKMAPELVRIREMMDRQVGHMVHLIDDLLDIARITSGKVELNMSPVALTQILTTAIEASRPALDSAGHQFVSPCIDDDMLIHGDEVRLAQVLGNLLTNAAKYTPNGGLITLTVTAGDGAVNITIADNGVGIPEDSLPHVFDMFSQVSRNLGRAQGGLGIGLSIVRQLVELHGGRVSVTSGGVGQGSQFTINLPLAAGLARRSVKAESIPAVGPPPTARSLRILVADDNVDAALSLSSLLEIRGHRVQSVHDGVAALEKACAFNPDIMFLDIGMPGLTGHEVARAIRNQPALAPTLLVALTGWGAKDDLQRARDAGFDHHLTKPAHFADVDAMLQRAIASGS